MNNLPENIKSTLDMYVSHRIPTGDFLYAVLTNDLFAALSRADDLNRYRLYEICNYIYNSIPFNCWGSKETVNAWLASKG
jgi:hypothetical protein